MTAGQERLRELAAKPWLTTREVAEILGCTRQHVTWLVRRDRNVTDPTRGLIADGVDRGPYEIYSYKPADVFAFRDGPRWRGRSSPSQPQAA